MCIRDSYYGLQGAVTWKGFDVSMNWQGAAGFSIYWYSVGQNSTSTILGYGPVSYTHLDVYKRQELPAFSQTLEPSGRFTTDQVP